jgi:hypothetical protein
MSIICLPKEYYIILMFSFFTITLFYIYCINNSYTEQKENTKLYIQKLPVQQPIQQPIPQPIIQPRIIEKRIILENRDRAVLNDQLKAPERRDQAYSYPTRYIRDDINLPSRGYPDNYQTLGVLSRKADEKILQLFGRQKYPGSNQWEYYVAGMDRNGFPNKIPLKVKGDKEILDKENINLSWLDNSKGSFEVNLYDYNVPRYNPYEY